MSARRFNGMGPQLILTILLIVVTIIIFIWQHYLVGDI